MELRILCKRLVADDLDGKFTVGENAANTVGITLPRYYEKHDLSRFSFRITAAGESKNSATQVLKTDNFDEKSVHLLWKVTLDFTAVCGKTVLILTGVNFDNNVTVKFLSWPITINPDKSWEFLPSTELSEQLLNQVQVEVQKAINAASRAEKASQTHAPAEIYPATDTQLGGIKSGNDISVDGSGSVTVNSVSGKTLGKSVPENAVFTDTVYTLPKATTQTLGGVKVDGTTINANSDGTISALDIENLKAEVAELKSIIGFSDSDIIGLHADFENNIFTRLAGAVGKNAGSDFDIFPMYGGRKRCNVLDDGTITAYYGDSNFTEDGSNGQVMVYQPKFYYNVVPLKLEPQTDGYGYHLRSANYYISSTPKIGFKLHPAFYDENKSPVDYILFSAYEGSIYDTSANAYLKNDEQVADFSADKLSSIADAKPCSGKSQYLTRTNAEQLAENRGNGWHCSTIKIESANQLLMIIEFAAFDLQSAIGQGVISVDNISGSNCAVNTGITFTLGNVSGIAEGVEGKVSVSYRGMENPWGNIWKFICGISEYIDNNGIFNGYICNDFNFTDNILDDNYQHTGFSFANSDGYCSAFGYSSKFDWLFIASETISPIEQSASKDFYWCNSSLLNSQRNFLLGGFWFGGAKSGYFCLSLDDNSYVHNSKTGSRIIFIPQNKM